MLVNNYINYPTDNISLKQTTALDVEVNPLRNYRNRIYHPWNKGLTKYTDKRLAQFSKLYVGQRVKRTLDTRIRIAMHNLFDRRLGENHKTRLRYYNNKEQISTRRKELYKQRTEEQQAKRKLQLLIRDRERNRKKKLIIVEHYSKGENCCACCGERHIEFMTIDHIYKNGKIHREKVGQGTRLYSWLIKNKFPKGYRILCYNCNCSQKFKNKCIHEIEKESVV